MKGEIGTRELANVVYGAAGSSLVMSLDGLFAAIAKVAKQCVDKFNARELANTAWAYATVSQEDANLFTLLARTAEWRVGEFNAQDLANIAWVFAAVAQQDA